MIHKNQADALTHREILQKEIDDLVEDMVDVHRELIEKLRTLDIVVEEILTVTSEDAEAERVS